jgi:hypothetical protein
LAIKSHDAFREQAAAILTQEVSPASKRIETEPVRIASFPC